MTFVFRLAIILVSVILLIQNIDTSVVYHVVRVQSVVKLYVVYNMLDVSLFLLHFWCPKPMAGILGY